MTTTEKPDLFHYTGDAEFGPLAGVSLRNGVRMKNHPQAGDAIVFDQVKHNGKFITPTVRLAGKPKLQAAWDSHEKAHADYAAGQRAALAANVPGLDALKAAVSGEERYNRQFDRMMNDENNDGARPPASPRGPSSQELAAKHPRAAAYLRAEGYANAAHDQKAAAGKRAMELLAAGGSVEDADAILKNWLPATAWEN